MFSYVAKSLLNKTLRAFLRKYLENIELESINYGYHGSSSSSSVSADSKADNSGWGVRLSNVKLREGMELMKLPGKHKRVVTRKRKVKKHRDEKCPSPSTPATNNTGGKETHILQPNPIDVDDSDVSFYEDHTSFVSRRDSESGYCSSTSTSPIQSNRLLCRLPSNCMSASTKATEKWQSETEPSDMILADKSESCTQEKDCYSNILMMHKFTDRKGKDEEDTYIELDEEVVIEQELTLVVGAGGVIGTLDIKYIGKDLHVTIEDAHLIVEAVPSNALNQKDDNETSKSPRPKMKRDISSVSDAEPPAETTQPKKSTIGEKIETKSMIAKYLSLIPHLFLRDCRLTLIFPEETEYDENPNDSCDDCTVLEFGIDFLSVSSGDDFMDALRFHAENRTAEETQPRCSPNSNSGIGSQRSQVNIFSRKRVRTGKGPDAGVWIKIQPPVTRSAPHHRSRQSKGFVWARDRFLDSSGSYFLRCSGLDLQARMLVDREDVAHDVSNAWSNEYEDYTMDSMLFGVDYIDPVSLARHQIKKKLSKEQNLTSEPIDFVSDIDSNGIQSIPHASKCHWIAQRRHLMHCNNGHLPLNECYFCWSECVRAESNEVKERNMSKQMPLPGFVICLSISDPLEVNVDHCSLQSLGYINSLFMSENQQPSEVKEAFQPSTNVDKCKKPGKQNSIEMSSNFDEESFPAFMQPHAVYLSSLSVSNLILRIEAIRSDENESNKWNFRFWQFQGHFINYEEYQIDTEEQFIRDATFHVERMDCRDFTGACEKTLFSLARKEDTKNAVLTGRLGGDHLSCTASRVLGVSQLASNYARASSSYAVRLRLIQSDFPSSDASQQFARTSRIGYVNLQIGLTNIDVDDKLIGDISDAVNEATSILFPEENTSETKEVGSDNDTKGDLNWLCQVSVAGGSVTYAPHIKLKIPGSTFRLRISPEGSFFETFLHCLSIEYGLYSFEKTTAPSILLFHTLPESSRMHILLYLNDLSPLEEVLNVKLKKQSLFLRSHALSKRLARPPLSCSSSKKIGSTRVDIRRDKLLKLLQSLDTDSLEDILAMHMKSIAIT